MERQLTIKDLIITLVAMNRGFALWCDGSNLNVDTMTRFLPMLHSVVVSSSTVVVLPTTSKMAAGHTEPKIGF